MGHEFSSHLSPPTRLSSLIQIRNKFYPDEFYLLISSSSDEVGEKKLIKESKGSILFSILQ
jgi:hypothetical protein